jgi:chemotaxis signal transduction protein
VQGHGDSSGVLGLDHTDRGIRAEPDGYVMLRLGGGRYAVGMSTVAEVGRLPRLLGAAITPTGSLGRLVVLSENTVTVGLLTEGVQGVVNCDTDRIDPPPMTLDSEAGSLLIGQFTEPTGPIAVLDPSAVLSLRLRLPSPRRAG